jgi:hypothetical protein
MGRNRKTGHLRAPHSAIKCFGLPMQPNSSQPRPTGILWHPVASLSIYYLKLGIDRLSKLRGRAIYENPLDPLDPPRVLDDLFL